MAETKSRQRISLAGIIVSFVATLAFLYANVRTTSATAKIDGPKGDRQSTTGTYSHLAYLEHGWPASWGIQASRVDVYGGGVDVIQRGIESRTSYGAIAINLSFLALGIWLIVLADRLLFRAPDERKYTFHLRTLFIAMAICAAILAMWKLAQSHSEALREDATRAVMSD